MRHKTFQRPCALPAATTKSALTTMAGEPESCWPQWRACSGTAKPAVSRAERLYTVSKLGRNTPHGGAGVRVEEIDADTVGLCDCDALNVCVGEAVADTVELPVALRVCEPVEN